jgi:hypothetical protein
MVEVEIGVLQGQCLDRIIDDPKRLISEIAAWEKQRNAAAASIKWMFTTEKARTKMGRAYPSRPKSHNHCAEVLVIRAQASSARPNLSARAGFSYRSAIAWTAAPEIPRFVPTRCPLG